MDRELNLSALGQNVKRYRVKKGYSADHLGEITGVSKSHIVNIESANSHASTEVLVRIANALDVSVDTLLCDSLERKAARDARILEYANLMKDCDERETKIIVDTVRILKDCLREAETERRDSHNCTLETKEKTLEK